VITCPHFRAFVVNSPSRPPSPCFNRSDLSTGSYIYFLICNRQVPATRCRMRQTMVPIPSIAPVEVNHLLWTAQQLSQNHFVCSRILRHKCRRIQRHEEYMVYERDPVGKCTRRLIATSRVLHLLVPMRRLSATCQ
jgi:hypothetical protein